MIGSSLLVLPSLCEHQVSSLDELHALLARVVSGRHKREYVAGDTLVVGSLDTAVAEYGQERFFSLLARVLSRCTAASPYAVDAELLRRPSFHLSRASAHWLLGNALLLNVRRDVASHTRLDFAQLFQARSSRVAVQRILCLLHYLAVDPTEELVVFSRCSFDLRSLDLTAPLHFDNVLLHDKSMETQGGAFVDFANNLVHIGEVIPSATQEEVLFSCCPELFALLVACEPLGESDVIVVENVRRFVRCSGYRESFQCDGPENAINVHAVLIMDAQELNHFRRSRHDLAKACAAFSNCKSVEISTGPWGCGVFGGNKVHKFLLQAIAAHVAGKTLQYSFFGSSAEVKELEEVKSRLRGRTIGSLLDVIESYASFQEELCDDDTFQSYGRSDRGAGFADYLAENDRKGS
jgi:poly(ADP-ribose) glycohydrolase